MADPLALWALCEDLLARVNGRLITLDVNPPQRVYVSPGAPPADECCAGQLTVHIERTYVSSVFPLENLTFESSRCNAGTEVAIVVVSMFRCVPTDGNEGDHGFAPALVDLQAAAQQLLIDQLAIVRAMRCAIYDWDDAPEAVFAGVTQTEPVGDCVGIEGRLLVEVDGLCCQDTDEPVDPDLLLPGVLQG